MLQMQASTRAHLQHAFDTITLSTEHFLPLYAASCSLYILLQLAKHCANIGPRYYRCGGMHVVILITAASDDPGTLDLEYIICES